MTQVFKTQDGNKYCVIRCLASIICLAAAGYSFWTTHDLISFIILIGIATDKIEISEAIGWFGRHISPRDAAKRNSSNQEDVDNKPRAESFT